MQQLQSNLTSKRCVKIAVSKLPAKVSTKPRCPCVRSHPQHEPAQGALPRPEYVVHTTWAGICSTRHSHIHSALSTCERKVNRREMMMRKRLLTLQKRECWENDGVQDHAANKHPAIHQGRAEGQLHMICPLKHRETCCSCWALTHGATQQILLLTEARRCQSADWAQHWAQLEHCFASVKSTNSWLQAPTEIQTQQSQQLSGSRL